jgi:hypothetical protein
MHTEVMIIAFPDNLFVNFCSSFGFIVIPQVLYDLYKPAESSQNDTGTTSVLLNRSDFDSFLQLYEENNVTTHLGTGLVMSRSELFIYTEIMG